MVSSTRTDVSFVGGTTTLSRWANGPQLSASWKDARVRLVVYGAGAIGGVLGGRCREYGAEVVLIARGEHLRAINERGLVVQSPDGAVTLQVRAVGAPSDVRFGSGDVVVLAMKSQDTRAALDALREVVPPETPIVCAQNGVANERSALRVFPNVYGMCVMCPASHLEPGVVQASSSPITGLMDVGRWPSGTDQVSHALASVLTASTFSSVSRNDIARWKWGKLLLNLGNAVEALCGHDPDGVQLVELARAEGVACLEAAGIESISPEEDSTRRDGKLTPRPIAGSRRGGGSTWQSLTRSLGSVETDYLTGEVVLLGRLFGIPTPVNELLQRLVNDAARRRVPPGSSSANELLGLLDASTR
jgi:2-dehydropantoate 2-reductase